MCVFVEWDMRMLCVDVCVLKPSGFKTKNYFMQR